MNSNIHDQKVTPIISHTDREKALEMALCYVEQQASASSIDVMFLKMEKLCGKSSNFQSSAEKTYWFLINFSPNGM